MKKQCKKQLLEFHKDLYSIIADEEKAQFRARGEGEQAVFPPSAPLLF